MERIEGRSLSSRVIGYLNRLEKIEGGFSFAQTAPPCIRDTYYAILIFRLLGEKERPSEATIRWVSKEPFHNEAPLSTLACQVKLCSMLKIEVRARGIEERLRDELEKPPTPKRLFHLETLLKQMGAQPQRAALKEKAARLNPYPTPFDTLETLFYKAVLSEERSRTWKRKVQEWLLACRNGDGGYGCRPNTTSFLEHIYWATRLMKVANLQIGDKDKTLTLEFVLGSHSRRGGFGRAPEGVPFIESTYQALWIIDFLGKLEDCR